MTAPDHALGVYRRLIHDARICPGAFRLWHYFNDRRDKSGECWPEQRAIARELRCKTHSLSGWILQLVTAGYLSVREVGQNHHHVYQVHPGDGGGALPEWATRGAAESVSCRPKGNVASPPEATPRVAPRGDVSNHRVVITISEGGQPPRLSTAERISCEQSLRRLDEELKTLRDADLPRAAERKRYLKAERVQLLSKLGVPV
jgi:hypothetical protein